MLIRGLCILSYTNHKSVFQSRSLFSANSLLCGTIPTLQHNMETVWGNRKRELHTKMNLSLKDTRLICLSQTNEASCQLQINFGIHFYAKQRLRILTWKWWILLQVGKYGLCVIWLSWPLNKAQNADQRAAGNMKGALKHSLDISQICRQLFLRLRVLTVLGVCVAERVLAVCVATVMVMDLARIRGLILFDAELMVWGGTTERETEDSTRNKNKFPLT